MLNRRDVAFILLFTALFVMVRIIMSRVSMYHEL